MKIKRVTADWLHVPIPEEKQHTTDFGRIAAFDSTLVRVETEGGLVGFGEAKAAVGSAGTNAALASCIERELAPMIVGEDARDISRLWDVMYNGSRAHFAIARGHNFPVLGRRGLTVAAQAGIDMALWDILGKSLGAAGLAPARRPPPGAHAGLRLGRLGAGRADRGRAAGLSRPGRLQGGQDAGRCWRRHARPLGPPRPRRPRRSRRRDRHHVRCARHLDRGRGEALLPRGRRLQPRLARGAGLGRRQARPGGGARRRPTSRSPAANPSSPASTSAT